MNFDELSNHYDGLIPYSEKMIARMGSYEAYTIAFLKQAERNFATRCLAIVQAMAAWRIVERYESAIIEMMLMRLQRALFQSRGSAIKVLGSLSNVAVNAAPINTA